MTNHQNKQQMYRLSHEEQQQQQQQQLQQKVSRKQRKMQGKLQKRQRIELAGGHRPRLNTAIDGKKKVDGSPFLQQQRQKTTTETTRTTEERMAHDQEPKSKSDRCHFLTNCVTTSHSSKHRFGRVMEQAPCRNKPRYSTLSIALPGSVLNNCQTKELRTLLVGQISRAATIYHVDEIIVFDDKLGSDDQQNHHYSSWREYKRRKQPHPNEDATKDVSTQQGNILQKHDDDDDKNNTQPRYPKSNSQEFMARLLQYCECPQYLRRSFFPMHPDLQFAGLLAPIDAPHHVRAEDRSIFREGVVMDMTAGESGNSLVNCGIRNRPVE
jgi:hypothetical protein